MTSQTVPLLTEITTSARFRQRFASGLADIRTYIDSLQSAIADEQNGSAGRFIPSRADEHTKFFSLELDWSGTLLMFRFTDQLSRTSAFGFSQAHLQNEFQDYRQLVRNHKAAAETKPAEIVEMHDRARRLGHNQSADALTGILDGKVELGREAARQLFSLIDTIMMYEERRKNEAEPGFPARPYQRRSSVYSNEGG